MNTEYDTAMLMLVPVYCIDVALRVNDAQNGSFGIVSYRLLSCLSGVLSVDRRAEVVTLTDSWTVCDRQTDGRTDGRTAYITTDRRLSA